MKKLLLLSLLFCALPAFSQTCSPIGGLGNVQFLDNSGNVLTNGVLYSFVAGTSTQQATFTDSTCTVQNVNPITFGTGARVAIWLTTSAFYKFVLCAQNDGSSCAGGDILFSVDQVPGGATSGGGGGGGAPFITNSANPATTGILRLASGDAICWRNTANSANLCFTKDTNDLLSWAGGSIKLPEVGAPTGVATFDILYADSTAHRLKMLNNGGSAVQVVASGNDISTSDGVTAWHWGTTQTPLSSTAPTTSQCIQWNGSAVVGVACTGVSEATWSASNSNAPGSFVLNAQMGGTVFPSAHTLIRFTILLPAQETGCSTAPVLTFRDATGASNLASLTIANSTNFFDSGALSVAMTGGDEFVFQFTTAGSGCAGGSNGLVATVVYK